MLTSQQLISPLVAATTIGPAIETVAQARNLSPEAIELLLYLAALSIHSNCTTRAEAIDLLSGEDAQQFAKQYGRAVYELQTAQLLSLSNNGNGAIRLKTAGHDAIRELSAAHAAHSQQALKRFGEKLPPVW